MVFQFANMTLKQHPRTLIFPREKPTEKQVSQDAIDLISRILQEREFRLCSPRYRVNDILIGRPVTSNFLYSMDRRNINSYYVFPNDAMEIKAHPFFRGVQWNQLHLISPPMVPRIKGWEDTRYFEDWKSSGHTEELTTGSENEESDEKTDESPDVSNTEGFTPAQLDHPVSDIDAIGPVKADPQKTPVTGKKKARKRARDKILRDKKVGKTALEIRKKSIFLGYTYRRPKGPALALIQDRGRQRLDRDQMVELYAA